MSRAHRQRAYCTFCKASRAITKSGKPVGHTKNGFGCPGLTKVARGCEACDGTGKLKSIYDTYDDELPCNVCNGEKRIVK